MLGSRQLRENFYGWLLISPFVLSLLIFFVFALFRTIEYSFANYDLFSAPSWVALDNYIWLFQDPLFLRASINTISFSIIVTSIQTVLALCLAVVINGEIRGKGFFRTAYYLPSIMSSAAITLIFIWFYQKNGFLNQFLTSSVNSLPLILGFIIAFISSQLAYVVIQRRNGHQIGVFDPVAALFSVLVAALIVGLCLRLGWLHQSHEVVQISWLGTRDIVGPMPLTLWAIVIQNIFTTVPTLMLLFLAGLQSISADLYEAAEIDGANKFQQLIHITIPQLAPVTFVVITMSIIGTLQMFDQVALLGAGVPLESRITLAYYVYHYAFPDGSVPRVGVASAAAIVLGVITIVIVIIQKRFGVREKQDV